MSIICPSCRNPNEDGATFCDNCGTALSGMAAPPPRPAAPSPLPPTAGVGGVQTCPQCNQPVTPGEAFCDNCGAALTGMAPPPPAPSYAPPPTPPVPPSYGPPPAPAPPAYPPQAPPSYGPPPTPPAYPPPPPAPAAPAYGPPSAGAATCPSCGSAVQPGAAFCDNCGASLSGAAPAPMGQQPVYPQPIQQPAQVPYPPPGPPAYPSPVGGPPPRLVVQPSNASLPFPPGKPEIIVGREDPVSNVFPEIDLDPHGGDEGGVSRRHAKFTLRGAQWYVEDLNSVNFTFVNKQKVQPGQPHTVNNGDEVRLGRVTMTFFAS